MALPYSKIAGQGYTDNTGSGKEAPPLKDRRENKKNPVVLKMGAAELGFRTQWRTKFRLGMPRHRSFVVLGPASFDSLSFYTCPRFLIALLFDTLHGFVSHQSSFDVGRHSSTSIRRPRYTANLRG